MRKTNILLSMLLLMAMVLAACGAEETQTPNTDLPPVTVEATATDDMTATEMPTEPGVATETAGVPVTGQIDPARVSNELEFSVVDQSGSQVGDVNDMILDLDNASVAYVIVDANGRQVAVPWNMLDLQTGTGMGTGTGEATAAPTDANGTGTDQPTPDASIGGGSTPEATGTTDAAGGTGTDQSTATVAPTTDATGGTGTGTGIGISGQNVFVLQTDATALDNAPEFDPGTLPQMGQSVSDWDAEILSYWQGTGTGTDSTPAPQGTAVPDNMTATPATGGAGTGTDQSTATATVAPTTDAAGGTGTGTDTGTQGVMALQGVTLASEVLGTTVSVGAMGTGTGTGTSTGQATAAPTDTSGTGGTGAGQATSTPGTDSATATTTTDSGTGAGSGTGTTTGTLSATIEDLIVDTDSGDILYLVINTMLDAGERLIPVPVSMFQWDGSTQGFVLNADSTMLQSAPNFEDGQFPDTSMQGWNDEFDSFWQNNGSGSGSGSGTGGDATATP